MSRCTCELDVCAVDSGRVVPHLTLAASSGFCYPQVLYFLHISLVDLNALRLTRLGAYKSLELTNVIASSSSSRLVSEPGWGLGSKTRIRICASSYSYQFVCSDIALGHTCTDWQTRSWCSVCRSAFLTDIHCRAVIVLAGTCG